MQPRSQRAVATDNSVFDFLVTTTAPRTQMRRTAHYLGASGIGRKRVREAASVRCQQLPDCGRSRC